MWECKYAGEPVDYRFIWLRFIKKIWIIPIAMIIGALIVTLGHYLSRTIENGGRVYQTTSIFYLDFAEKEDGSEHEFINYYTWGELIHSDYFIDNLDEALGGKYPREQLIKAVSANIESDVRYLYVRCTTTVPENSLEIASALEPIVIDFAKEQKEFDEIKLSTKGDSYIDSTKLRLGNAAVLGIVLGLVISVVAVLLSIVLDTSIYIPATIERRYGLKTLGAECMSEYTVNCDCLLGTSAKVAYVSVDGSETVPDFGDREVVNIGNILSETSAAKLAGECDVLVLGVKACARNDKMFERVVEELARLGIKITAVVLCDADDKFIKSYYKC